MKKLFILLLAAPLLFTSCNKKLKKEMDELEQEVATQKAQNENLQNQLNSVNSLLGSNEPINITTTFQDDNNITRTVSSTYSFKSGSYSSHYMEENLDGTYDIYINRFSDVEWDEDASISFTYNPSNGAITNSNMYHYWSWNVTGYNSSVYYNSYYSPAPTISITLHKISTTTGEIDLSATASVVDGYNGYVPNPGKGCSSTLTFKGILGVMSDSF